MLKTAQVILTTRNCNWSANTDKKFQNIIVHNTYSAVHYI